MSIWVRLIGGPHNGQVAKVDEDQVEHAMRSQVPIVSQRVARNFGIPGPASVEIKVARYTKREVKGPGWSIVYFAEERLSDHEALQLVLGP